MDRDGSLDLQCRTIIIAKYVEDDATVAFQGSDSQQWIKDFTTLLLAHLAFAITFVDFSLALLC
jgi:hypothetical protein